MEPIQIDKFVDQASDRIFERLTWIVESSGQYQAICMRPEDPQLKRLFERELFVLMAANAAFVLASFLQSGSRLGTIRGVFFSQYCKKFLLDSEIFGSALDTESKFFLTRFHASLYLLQESASEFKSFKDLSKLTLGCRIYFFESLNAGCGSHAQVFTDAYSSVVTMELVGLYLVLFERLGADLKAVL